MTLVEFVQVWFRTLIVSVDRHNRMIGQAGVRFSRKDERRIAEHVRAGRLLDAQKIILDQLKAGDYGR